MTTRQSSTSMGSTSRTSALSHTTYARQCLSTLMMEMYTPCHSTSQIRYSASYFPGSLLHISNALSPLYAARDFHLQQPCQYKSQPTSLSVILASLSKFRKKSLFLSLLRISSRSSLTLQYRGLRNKAAQPSKHWIL